MPKLFLKFNEAVLKEIAMEGPQLTIGRKPDNDVVIDNPAVSGHHARIVQEQGAFFLEDLDSTNGSFVNDAQVHKQQLKNTDRVAIGKHVLVFQEDAPAAAPAPPQKETDSDKTMILDTKKQRELLKAMQTMQSPVGSKAVEKLGFLTIVSGQTDKKDYELTGRLAVIGAENTATVKLTGWFAPKNAALIARRGPAYFLSTPQGAKKITVNSETVQGQRELQDGDTLMVAGVLLQFVLKDQKG